MLSPNARRGVIAYAVGIGAGLGALHCGGGVEDRLVVTKADAALDGDGRTDATTLDAGRPDAPDAACAEGPDDPPGPHGTYDSTFADGGIATVRTGAAQIYQQCLFGLAGDGVLLLGSTQTEGNSIYVNTGVPFSANGASGASWSLQNGRAAACAQAPDRSVFFATRADLTYGARELTHVDATGTLDMTFGHATVPFQPIAMAVSAAGNPIIVSKDPGQLVIARFGADGTVAAQTTLRPSTTGYAITRGGLSGHVFVAGVDSATRLARVVNDGVDPSFGDAGWATLPTASPTAGALLAVDDLDRVLVAVTTQVDVVIARFTPAGQLDPCFGQGGITHLQAPGGVAIAAQRNGKLVIGAGFGLQRLDSNGVVDLGFGPGGSFAFTMDPFSPPPALAVLPGGDIAAAFGVDNGFGHAVIRLHE